MQEVHARLRPVISPAVISNCGSPQAGQQLQCTNAWDFSPHHLRGGRSAVRRATVSAPVPDFHATAAAPAATVKQEPTARGEPPRASHVSPPPSYPQPQLAPPLPHKAGLQAAGDMSGLQAAGDALSRCVDATLELLEGAARLRQQQQQQKPGAGAAALPGAGHQRRAGSGQGAEDEEAAGRISGKELQVGRGQCWGPQRLKRYYCGCPDEASRARTVPLCRAFGPGACVFASLECDEHAGPCQCNRLCQHRTKCVA